MNTVTTDLGRGEKRGEEAENRLRVWAVSWESPLPASQGSSILFTKSAHIETSWSGFHSRGDREGGFRGVESCSDNAREEGWARGCP